MPLFSYVFTMPNPHYYIVPKGKSGIVYTKKDMWKNSKNYTKKMLEKWHFKEYFNHIISLFLGYFTTKGIKMANEIKKLLGVEIFRDIIHHC